MAHGNESEAAETAQMCAGNNNSIGEDSENNSLMLNKTQEDEFEINNAAVEIDGHIEEIDNVEDYETSNDFDENEDWKESIYKKHVKLLRE